MNSSPKLPTKHPDRVAEPLAGGCVVSASLPGKGGLSDWVELMEVVEALCPVWPEREGLGVKGKYKL
jgi:hypothetical protein